jgi:DNA-binding transcriptional LysR family regulator
LFDRAADPLRLTAVGARYLAEPAVVALRQATLRVRSTRLSASCASWCLNPWQRGWLVRRLPDFYAQGANEIELHMTTNS